MFPRKIRDPNQIYGFPGFPRVGLPALICKALGFLTKA